MNFQTVYGLILACYRLAFSLLLRSTDFRFVLSSSCRRPVAMEGSHDWNPAISFANFLRDWSIAIDRERTVKNIDIQSALPFKVLLLLEAKRFQVFPKLEVKLHDFVLGS